MTRPWLLDGIFFVWILGCVVGGLLLRRAPAVSLALWGGALGAIAGFLAGNADGPAEVPAYSAVGASIGLVSNGAAGILLTSARSSSAGLRRAALITVVAAVPAAIALTALLRVACPLYVRGRGSGFCNFRDVDVLGGWISGVIVAFGFDAVFVAALFLVSAQQVRLDGDPSHHGPRRPAAI
jgi:hypothetical protein